MRYRDLKHLIYLSGSKALWCSVVAAFGGIFVAGIEASVAIFFQLFLKALGFSSEMDGKWTWLSDLSLTTLQLSLMLGFVGLVRSAANIAVGQSIVIANESMVARLRTIMFSAILKDEKDTYLEPSRLNFFVSDIIPKMGMFLGNVTQIFSVSMLMVCVCFVMLQTSWIHAVIGIFGLGIAGIVVLKINKHIAQVSRQLPEQQGRVLAGTQRVGRNWLLVKILRTGNVEFDEIRDAIDKNYSAATKGTLWTYVGGESPPVLGIILLVIIIFLQLTYIFAPNGQFIVFLYLFLRFAQYAGAFAKCVGVASTYYPTYRIGAEWFAERSDHSALLPIKTAAELTHEKGMKHKLSPPSIELKNVSFSYVTGGENVVTDLNLRVESGEHLGIVGRSGTGKSTILSLMLGVLKPTSGLVLINGAPSSEYFQSFGDHLGYVGADSFLKGGTIRDNLGYGFKGSFTDELCWGALKRALLDDVIREKPGQLNFRINENGDGLSAGQKQRLALARALMREPLFLVLDEASANVDEKTEAEIARLIASLRGKVTCVIVSHRPGFLAFVDRTIRL